MGRTDGHKKQVTTEGANTHPPPPFKLQCLGILKSEKKLQKLTGQLRGRVRENANCAHSFGTAEEKQTELTLCSTGKTQGFKNTNKIYNTQNSGKAENNKMIVQQKEIKRE